jgi:hypothetical protein
MVGLRKRKTIADRPFGLFAVIEMSYFSAFSVTAWSMSSHSDAPPRTSPQGRMRKLICVSSASAMAESGRSLRTLEGASAIQKYRNEHEGPLQIQFSRFCTG